MEDLFCYLHIPFCESKCKYCRFASVGVLQDEKIQKYVEKLILDIQNYDKKIIKLKSVYFGGGTPSVLSIEQLSKIIIALQNKFSFEDDIEITIESTPQNISKDNIVGWKKIGINRLSIGIQTLNEDSLEEIGRENSKFKESPHPNPLPKGEGTKTEEGGIDQFDVNLDFIIGLPYVKKGEVKKDIEYMLDNYDFVKHVSVYMLEDYYYPGKWDKISIKEEEYLGEYIELKDFLKSKGFDKYEVSNFAKKPSPQPSPPRERELDQYECKHNKAYWDHSEVVAFGLGSHGFIDGKRYSYSENFKDYYDDKIIEEDKLTEEDIFLEKIMFGLRTNGLHIDLYSKLNQEKIYYFIDNGYLKIESDILKLENKGVVVLDYIMSEII